MSIELQPEHPGHTIRLGSQLLLEIYEDMVVILRKDVGLFALRSKVMKGINPEVAVHSSIYIKSAKPVKQKRRPFREQHNEITEKEVQQMLKI